MRTRLFSPRRMGDGGRSSRTKVRAGEQWKVGREFNRRIKRRFDELGIELPVPQQKIQYAGSLGGDCDERQQHQPGRETSQLLSSPT